MAAICNLSLPDVPDGNHVLSFCRKSTRNIITLIGQVPLLVVIGCSISSTFFFFYLTRKVHYMELNDLPVMDTSGVIIERELDTEFNKWHITIIQWWIMLKTFLIFVIIKVKIYVDKLPGFVFLFNLKRNTITKFLSIK